jgi:hypothetical protein
VGRDRTPGHDEIYRPPHQLDGEVREPSVLGELPLQDEVLALNVSMVAQPLKEGIDQWRCPGG